MGYITIMRNLLYDLWHKVEDHSECYNNT